jgi:hypothetical protein
MNQRNYGYLVAGVFAGMVGLLTFLVIHALWILPIWSILPIGMVMASLGGLAVGWAYAEVHHRLPKRPWTLVAVVGLIALILTPSVMIAEVRPPMFTINAAGQEVIMEISEIVARFIGELLVTATLAGGLLGAWLGRTRRAIISMAVAGFIFALGPGHNIPFIGGTTGVAKEIAIMMIVIIVSALALVEGHAQWARWQQTKIGRDKVPAA